MTAAGLLDNSIYVLNNFVLADGTIHCGRRNFAIQRYGGVGEDRVFNFRCQLNLDRTAPGKVALVRKFVPTGTGNADFTPRPRQNTIGRLLSVNKYAGFLPGLDFLASASQTANYVKPSLIPVRPNRNRLTVLRECLDSPKRSSRPVARAEYYRYDA